MAISPGTVDVFLSHKSADKPAVESIARKLVTAGVTVFLDKWHLIPGEPWQEALEVALKHARTCAVFLGPGGLGAWENEEMRAALSSRVSSGLLRVIPVLLPEAGVIPDRAALPPFLARLTWVDFRAGLSDDEALHNLLSGIRGLPPGQGAEPRRDPTGAAPYRGLNKFQPEDAEWFFGRESETQQLLEKLRSARFLALLGASGSGKSSLALAGLVPALKAGRIPGSDSWIINTLTPTDQPLEELATRLGQVDPGRDVTTRLQQLELDERALHLMVRELMRDRNQDVRFVLIVDQFEEVFTLCNSPKTRRSFIDQLLHASGAESGRCSVVITMRADFLAKCTEHGPLADRMSAFNFLVTPMTVSQLRDAIERPAIRADLELEPGLTDLMLRDVEGQPGGLPLLQHALYELWKRSDSGTLSLAAYAEIEGVTGAVARTAENLFARLDADEQRLVKTTMIGLIQPGAGTEDTRRRARLSELVTDVNDTTRLERIVKALADERLVTIDSDATGADVIVQVAHEALIRKWTRLRGWMADDRAFLVWRRRLSTQREEWTRLGGLLDGLLRGLALSEAEQWESSRSADMTPTERGFIAASVAQRNRDAADRERSRKQRFRLAASVSSVILTLFVVASVMYLRQSDQAHLAFSRYVTVQARDQLRRSPDVGLLLAAEAVRLSPTTDAQSSLIDAVRENPQLLRFHHNGRSSPGLPLFFSRDSRTLVTGSFVRTTDGIAVESLLLWDVRQGDSKGRLATLSAFGDLALTPDRRHFAAVRGPAILSGEVRELNERFLPTENGGTLPGEIFTNLGDKSPVQFTCLTFDREGKILGAGLSDGSVRLWRAADRHELRPPIRAKTGDSIDALAFDPDGRHLAYGTQSGAMVSVDLQTGNAESLGLIDGRPRAIAYSPDAGRLAILANDLVLLDASTRRPVWRKAGKQYFDAMAFSDDGQMIVGSRIRAHSVTVLDASSGDTLWEPEVGSENDDIASPDGNWLVSTKNNLRLMSPTREVVKEIPFGATAAVFNSDSSILYVAGSLGDIQALEVPSLDLSDDVGVLGQPAVLLSSLRNGATSIRESISLWTQSLILSPDSSYVASGTLLGSTILWQTRRRLSGTYDLPLPSVEALKQKWPELSANPFLAVVGLGARGEAAAVQSIVATKPGVSRTELGFQVTAWDARGTATTVLHASTGMVVDLSVLEDGTPIVLHQIDKTLTRLNALTWAALGPPMRLTSDNAQTPLKRTGTWGVLAAPARDGRSIEFWDAKGETLKRLGKISVPASIGSVGSIALAPDLRTVALGNADSSTNDTVTLIDLSSDRVIGVPLVGHDHDVIAVAFRPDGKALASVDHDGRIIVWLLPDGREFVRLGPQTGVHDLAFSPDGSRLAVTHDGQTAVVWALDADYWTLEACRMANRNLTLSEWQQFFGKRAYRKTCEGAATPRSTIDRSVGGDSRLLRRP